jgi:hypothetical protein
MGLELAQIKRAADIARALKIRGRSLSPRVTAKIRVKDLGVRLPAAIGSPEACAAARRRDSALVQALQQAPQVESAGLLPDLFLHPRVDRFSFFLELDEKRP